MNTCVPVDCAGNDAMRFALSATLREKYYAEGYWRAEDLWESFAAVGSVSG